MAAATAKREDSAADAGGVKKPGGRYGRVSSRVPCSGREEEEEGEEE